jgi:TfoX/Sxy family transcriptional regulator of competence genes
MYQNPPTTNMWWISMEWKKAPEELAAFLADAMKGIDCEYRRMFGYPAYFIHGNMFIGAFQDTLFIRLSESDRKRIMTCHPGVMPFEPRTGKPTKEYVVLPVSLYTDKESFGEWLGKSVQYVSSLPPKKGARNKEQG